MLGKKILIGVCGGIAAYKITFLIRLLIKEKAFVKVIMTPSAKNFISPLTLSALSKNPVYEKYFDTDDGSWHNHVELALWADMFVIAPATASTIGKMAHGISDNLLLVTYLSARCPVFICPAMDLDMYKHPAIEKNLDILKKNGNTVLAAQDGELASGLVGIGRMQEPEDIFQKIKNFFSASKRLSQKRVLITMGPTQESLDPVRFISNHSTGKMGFEIAKAFLSEGAEVKVVSGPTNISMDNISVTKVRSALEMLQAVQKDFEVYDIIIFAAAVADYRPKEIAPEKIKKNTEEMHITMVKNPDIAAIMGSHKREKQILIGFALETENEIKNAYEKMLKKNLDYIVLNSLKDLGAGFSHDTNKITIIEKTGNTHVFPLKPKEQVAYDIMDFVCKKMDV
ncbi:MAG: bifunctional phosphopantothenoylcysteine decarboxylase/phosphopantothenate--cysteine ligase CoaBC [Limnohabitans sp.]|nr:bifunctional phosphopantothenoylcysteine decarboxylase/phosphopantothenate--cysteine ligase CoaBC [Limnohabitans sp.]